MSQRICFCLCLLFGSLSFTPHSVHAVMLNEIRIDQPGSDRDEYFELTGLAHESLQDLSLIVIGDGTANQGVIEAVVDLDGLQLNADGMLLVAENSFGLTGHVDLYQALNFENGDNVTHMLVSHFLGQAGDDIDTNDDGGIDSILWHNVLDSVAIINDIKLASPALFYLSIRASRH